ncbi:MAG: hypothetical protein QM702_04295 [Rubrivivax sp.]
MTAKTQNIEDLRQALFSTLDGVRAGTIDLDKARAVNEISKTIIETAKVEVDYLRVTGGGESAFIAAIGADNLPPGLPAATPGNGIVGITQHRLKG